jgi:asparagine synthase (glutamine-hydrolysing)
MRWGKPWKGGPDVCGIAGIYNYRDGHAVDLSVVGRMSKALVHRGPDDEGLFEDRDLGLGFRRLAIIDLSGGHQPMTSDCGRFTVVFNGEIYNHEELRRVLQSDHGARFSTRSDTEVILAAYRQWGAGAVDRFNGMFALALWDSLERVLFLARDRLGKKPLYFSRLRGGLCFASEVKALLEHPEVSREVEKERIATFLAYRYVPGDETLFKGVECLPPASCVRVSAAGGLGETHRYWDYSFEPSNTRTRPEALHAELAELLTDAVRLRRVADVPVGAFLSGGLDSSVVVAMMSKQHPEPLKTFSIGFDSGVTEIDHARSVARLYGTDHHEIVVGSPDLIRNLPRVLHARESPVTEASDIPIYLLSQLARSKVTVVLSGEGSDEIFAGYPKYAFEHQVGRFLDHLPRSLLAVGAEVLPFRLRRVQLALEAAAEPEILERYAAWFGAFGPRERRDLLTPALNGQADLHAYSASALESLGRASRVEQMLYLDTRHWLPANLLLRGDRMTMAHSLELRCPFLDYRLVEFAARRVPLSAKIRGLSGKRLLKTLAEGLLPSEIVHRRKWGFKVPTSQWFRGPLRTLLPEVLLSRAARARGYFDPSRLRALIDDHVAGRHDHDKQLWILLQLELWHLMFVDRTLGPTDQLS